MRLVRMSIRVTNAVEFDCYGGMILRRMSVFIRVVQVVALAEFCLALLLYNVTRCNGFDIEKL